MGNRHDAAGGGEPPAGDGAPQWTARRLQKLIDERLLEDMVARGGRGGAFHAGREGMAQMLRCRPTWPRPDALNADMVNGLHLVWRTPYGKVEIDADKWGHLEYYTLRTVGGAVEEGLFKGPDAAELDAVMGWLEPEWPGTPKPSGAAKPARSRRGMCPS